MAVLIRGLYQTLEEFGSKLSIFWRKEVRKTGKKMRKELDKTIKTVSKKIRRDETAPEYCAETIKALASLVKARARLK